MQKLSAPSKFLFMPALLLILASASFVKAEQPSVVLQERFKTSVNNMVQQVQVAQDPTLKREILGKFLRHMDQRLGVAKVLLPKTDQPMLDAIRTKIESQYSELNGLNGSPKVADNNINAFAHYIQQDMEQADAYWTGGGLYISAGALIVIVILILILG